MIVSSAIRINDQLSIQRREFRFSFVRSSGPGGQNVNKVASKAVLRWQLAGSPSVPEGLRPQLVERLGRRVNDRGELIVASQRFRDQAKNIEDCVNKLCELLSAAAKVPKKRKKTRLPKAAREARLKQKRTTGEKKQSRRRPSLDD
jgi:ribosome-associated protein